MRIGVDRMRCEANEVCVSFAPAVFELGDDDELRILAPEVPEDEVERVTHAIVACPRNALFTVE
ncbi:ferredoxin [Amycolatopsis taiwanensis]|uniref:ferredoxin n=1 Tax=Amycolatopsis taiwanensis TaxID=342230 RepID=UPI000486ADEB|nr:ferredoxin [Amycolatopsis taiwanensis]